MVLGYILFHVYRDILIPELSGLAVLDLTLLITMPTNQELNQLRKTLKNALGTVNSALNNDEDDPALLETETIETETVAEVGDIVEIVVNPDTPEEEVIEGELVGVLDDVDEDVMDVEDDEPFDLCRTVLVRTKNGRVRKAKLPKSVKIRNSRKQNIMTVKTANGKACDGKVKNVDDSGLKEMRTGDTYKPPITEGLKISKNSRTQNEDGDDVAVPADEVQELVEVVQELAEKIDSVFGADVADTDNKAGRYVSNRNKHVIPPKETANASLAEKIDGAIQEGAKRALDKLGVQVNARYKRIKNYRKIQNGDGTYDILIDAEEVEIAPSCDENGGGVNGSIDPGAVVVEVVEGGQPVVTDSGEAYNKRTENTREVATNNASADTMLNAMLAVANLSTMPLITSAMMSCPEPVQEEYDMIPPKVTFGNDK